LQAEAYNRGMQRNRIEHRPGYLAVHCAGADERSLSETYRAFAVECLATQAKCVMLDASNSDPESHHGLRDALATMVLAGMPAGFRLAPVTNTPSLQRRFADLSRDLGALHIPAQVFAREGPAVEWLLERLEAHAVGLGGLLA
jgi:hypothetical protein